MSYFIKVICLLFVITIKTAGGSAAHLEVMGLLLLVASYIYREKYADLAWLLAGEALLVFLLSWADPVYLALYGSTAFDLASRGLHYYALALAPAGFIFFLSPWSAAYLLLLVISGYAGFLRRQLLERKTTYQQAYDRERQTRYALEETKAKLLQAARKTAHLAEIRERNRIAREIHDSVGHKLAGILLLLQATAKVQGKDPVKAEGMLQQAISGLAGAVELLRDTVHNLKPAEEPGLAYFEAIIENFRFCPVDFRPSGDFTALTPHQVEILSSTLKEALTNAARHSGADRVEVHLEIREKIIRLYIKDNGRGCETIREGLGISGMKERVRNAGGQITINPAAGSFMIVCVLPREERAEGDEHAGAL